MNIARKKDAIKERRNASPNSFTIFVFFVDSSVIPVSFIHLFTNIRGEYQRLPSINALVAATILQAS